MDNQRLLRVYKSIHGSSIPLRLQQFISSGELADFPDTLFTHAASGQKFLVQFIKDMEMRMDGTADQGIRLAIAKANKSDEPIGFAELIPEEGEDEFLYYLIAFPKPADPNHMITVLDETDPCPLYIAKLKAKTRGYACTILKVADSLDEFINGLKSAAL